MDAQTTDLPQRARGLEDTLAALDVHLAEAERQAATLLKAVRRLRRAAREGAVASLPAAIAAAKADADRNGEPLAKAAATLDYDVADAFASGAWLDELAAAAKDAGVVLVRRDGRVTAYPVALRLDARAQGVRIGRKLERRIRPSFVAAQLKALQQRPGAVQCPPVPRPPVRALREHGARRGSGVASRQAWPGSAGLAGGSARSADPAARRRQ